MEKAFRGNLLASTLALMLVSLWLAVRGYQGLTGDAQIYAFQALAKIRAGLANDLYLHQPSQDQFTVFSPFYASFVTRFGLEGAARLLTICFTTLFFVGAWNLAAAITNRTTAWLAVVSLIVIPAEYGGSEVLRLSEQYLTARLPAQALIIAAFACHANGMWRTAFVIVVLASMVHPIMALPGLLLLVCVSLPFRVGLSVTALGLILVLAIALSAPAVPAVAHIFAVMDKDWLEIVRERSQFLFPRLWSLRDWDTNLRPLAYLVFIWSAFENNRARKFCGASLVVGIAGLAVGVMADLNQPVAILVQVQAWRWVWIACLVSVLLLPATVIRIWNDEKCGQSCAMLLIIGWIVPVGGTACAFFALTLWSMRKRMGDRVIPYIRLTAVIIGISAVVWADGREWGAISPRFGLGGAGPFAFNEIRNLAVVKGFEASVFALLYYWLRRSRNPWAPISICAALLASLTIVIPESFKQARLVGSESDISEFSDWRAAIPEGSTVFVTPTRDVGTFVWFTLERPNYLALDQSAGVVFSRETALEVRRRSEDLLPLTDPTWKILSHIRSAGEHHGNGSTRPLTIQSLLLVCADPQLGFVISPQNIGLNPLRHEHAGVWKNWNLYDCGEVRSNINLKGST